MKFDEKELSKIEKKQKLNWLEKKAVKKMIRKAKKIILQYKEKVVYEVKERETLEKELLSFTDVLEIENDDGSLLNKENIKNLSNKELEETFELCLNEMEKLI